MTKPLTIVEVKKGLKKLDETELIELLLELYKSNGKVKEFVSSRFGGESYNKELFDEYKKKIFLEFFNRGFRTPGIKTAKSLLSDFSKFGSFDNTLDLMLFFVECGTGYTNDNGDMNQVYYDTLCRVYDEFIDLIKQVESKDLINSFKGRVKELASESSNIAWGYGYFIVDKTSEVSWDEDDFELEA